MRARARQVERYHGSRAHNNAQLRTNQIRKHCRIDGPGRTLIEQAVARLGLSGRAYMRILKGVRTNADLEQRDSIAAEHVAGAIQYPSLDLLGGGRLPWRAASNFVRHTCATSRCLL